MDTMPVSITIFITVLSLPKSFSVCAGTNFTNTQINGTIMASTQYTILSHHPMGST